MLHGKTAHAILFSLGQIAGMFARDRKRRSWLFSGRSSPVLFISPRIFRRRRPSAGCVCRRRNSYLGLFRSSDVAFDLFIIPIYGHFWIVFRVCFLFVYNLLLQYTHFVWYNDDTSQREPTDTHRRRADTSAVATLRRVRPYDEEVGNFPPHRKEGRL